MSAGLRLSATLTWLVLVGATAVAWGLGGGAASTAPAVAGMLLLAFLKLRLIVFHFMEVGRAPPGLRCACDAWMLAVCGGIGFLYWRVL